MLACFGKFGKHCSLFLCMLGAVAASRVSAINWHILFPINHQKIYEKMCSNNMQYIE